MTAVMIKHFSFHKAFRQAPSRETKFELPLRGGAGFCFAGRGLRRATPRVEGWSLCTLAIPNDLYCPLRFIAGTMVQAACI
jgi:hypothetical protein